MPSRAYAGMMTLCIPAAASPSSPPKSDNGFYARLGLGVGRGKVTSEIDVPQNNWGVEYEGVGWVLDAVAGARSMAGWH